MNISIRRPDIEALFKETDCHSPENAPAERPRIGISANRKEGMSCLADTYVQAVLDAGGVPVIIPVMTDIEALSSIVKNIDGLIMSGGGDINPLYLSEEPIPELQAIDTFRDEYDLVLIRLATNHQLPIMGICRGHQLLNIAFGGSIYQDIHAQRQDGGAVIMHNQIQAREEPSHTVRIEPNSRLYAILQEEKVAVNSFHHQAIKQVAPEFIATAVAPDGINEAIEHIEKPIWSVQWHPEAMAAGGHRLMKKLFLYHVEQAGLYQRTKALHRKIITIDSHTDTPMALPGPFDLGKKEGSKVNLPLMEEGLISAAFMVAYIPQGNSDVASRKAATRYAVERLNAIRRQEQLHPDRVGIAVTRQDLLRLIRAGKKAIFLGVENGYALGNNLQKVDMFHEMGVSYITLCHNHANDLCDSCKEAPVWDGLSPFGRQVVRRMNKLGMMIDVSHASEKAFYETIKISRAPVIASHSSVRTLCDHPRNLTDHQIKTLAECNGVVQICMYKGFLHPEAHKASVSDVIRHINYVVDLVGIEYVGIGSDFDGDGEVIGCRSAGEMTLITSHLLETGYDEHAIQQIWGGNLMRVLTEVRQQASPY